MSKGEGPHERLVGLASIEVLKVGEPAPDPAAKVAASSVTLPAGAPWLAITPEMGAVGMQRLVANAWHQLYARRSAGPDKVMIEAGGGRRCMALQEIKPHGLAVFPYVQDLKQPINAKKKSQTVPQVWVRIGSTDTAFKLMPPTPDAGESPLTDAGARPPQGSGESPAAGDAAGGASTEEAPPPMLDLFWELYKRKADGNGGLKMMYVEVSVPSASMSVKDPQVRAGMSKACGSVEVSLPYLTNQGQLARGDSLGLLG